MALSRSELEKLTAPDAFLWCTGIEDTFITAPWPKTGRTLDAYELTLHYDRWREDLGLMAELRVPAARYGIPWHRIQPDRNSWDWSFADAAFERMLELGVEPIVDLVHYGLPSWMESAFFHPDYPRFVAEYAARAAARYRGRIHAFTPLNEPRVTAWYCGKLGWWPPFARGWKGFTAVMLAVCRGIVETVHALASVDPEILAVHVDATDLYDTADPALEAEAGRRQEMVFLALDLVAGRVHGNHPLLPWLNKQGASEADLAWFRERAVELPLIGINLYPMFSRKVLSRSSRGLRMRMPYAPPEIIQRLGRLYWERYRRPLLISETAAEGSIERRRAWLEGSVQSVRALRAEGVPMVGYTWWPLFALVAWAHRQGEQPVYYHLKQMGLWDLASEAGGDLRRIRTPLVDLYRKLAEAGGRSAGRLKSIDEDYHAYVS